MEKLLERYLEEHFYLPPKNPSEEAQRRWRKAVGLIKNHRRRFRMVADLDQGKKIRVTLYVQQAAFNFIDGLKKKEFHLTEDVIEAGFSISPDEL